MGAVAGAAGVPAARILTVPQAAGLDQLGHRGFFTDLPYPDGSGRVLRVSGNGVLVDGEPLRPAARRPCSASTTPSGGARRPLARLREGVVTTVDDVARWWGTAVSRIEPGVIELRGRPVQELIGSASLVSVIWLLLRGSPPAPAEAALLEAALVASVDHGPHAPSIAAARMAATCGVGLNTAMATGVGMLGDVHGGAGEQFVQLLSEIVDAERARRGPGCRRRPGAGRLAGQLAVHPRLRPPLPPGRPAARSAAGAGRATPCRTAWSAETTCGRPSRSRPR